MIGRLATGALVAPAVALLAGGLGSAPAFACNSYDGCVRAFQREDYQMLHDGRNDGMMRSGRESIEAFQLPGSQGRQPGSALAGASPGTSRRR